MLHVIFDRLATGCVDTMKHLVASPIYYSLNGVESGRFGDLLDPYDANAVVGIFHAENWDGHILVGLDRDFIFTMVEVLLGADGSEPPLDDERNFSGIELRIAQMTFEQVGKALESAFSLVSKTPFVLERTETRLDFAVIGRRSNKALGAKFLLQGPQPRRRDVHHHPAIGPGADAPEPRQGAHRRILGPRPALGRADRRQGAADRGAAARRARGAHPDAGRDRRPADRQILALDATPKTLVKLEGNDQALFWCHVGQAQGSYVLRIDEPIAQEKEFMDDVLGR